MNNKKLHRNDILYPELSYKITGICFDVQNELGRYLNEKQYGDYLETLFAENGINYEREKVLPQAFDGEKARRNILDFIIEDCIVLELKTKMFITKQDYYQVQRYLNSYNKKLGLIVNFRQRYIKPRRVLNLNYKKEEKIEQKIFENKIKKYLKNS